MVFPPYRNPSQRNGMDRPVVKCNLRRGCIGAKPWPQTQEPRVADLIRPPAPAGTERDSECPPPGARHPSPSREGTIMEGIEAVTSPQRPPFHASSSHSPPPYSHRAGTDPPTWPPAPRPLIPKARSLSRVTSRLTRTA